MFCAALALSPEVGTAAEKGDTAKSDCVPFMLATRAALKGGSNVRASSWHTTGPLKAKSFSEVLFPEKGIDLEATKGTKMLWQSKSYPDGTVNSVKAGDSTANYLYRVLVAKTAEPLQISLGSDDGLEFWFNGEKLVSKDVPRGVAPDQDIVKVTLKPGTNTVLVKIFNRTGDSGFYFNTDRSTGGASTVIAQKFPAEAKLLARYANVDAWIANPENTSVERKAITKLLDRLGDSANERQEFDAWVKAAAPPQDQRWLALTLTLAQRVEAFDTSLADVASLNVPALRLAVEDLTRSFPDQYQGGRAFLEELTTFEKNLPATRAALEKGDRKALEAFARFKGLERKALLANPLLNFDDLLVVKRREGNLGLPQNWQGNSSLNSRAENELVRLPVKAANPSLTTVFKPQENYFVGDVDLNYDADKFLYSSIGTNKRWQVFEMKLDGSAPRQVSPTDEPDIDSYDAVYLPDGRIIFDSTSTFQGVPCVGGADYVANLHIMNPDGTGVRRLCFDQDNDWYPVVLPSGRVMYLRWEYTDSAHYFSRVLMSMNPDGTGQTEMYHSSSYWPNGIWYARPLPGSSTKFVGVISGHHGVPRMGELVIFDTARGRQEDSGAVQRIPGYGKPVKGIIKDELVNSSWPKFLHPYPLSDKYFLVSCKPTANSPWGIYLVDIFDNMLLLKEEPGWALFEPLPIRKTTRPPVIADKVKLGETNATVYVHDIYAGPGLRGVPRGTVKNLRLFQYEFSYRNQGGHYFVGMEGGWDVRRMIGTVPVEEDGSAMFRVPANTPVALQPLDDEGKALQQMRSWFVGMPGEFVSCVGCHEPQNSTTALRMGTAARKTPVDPIPWKGPKRGFSFIREVQPVLDKYCSGCHDGKEADRPKFSDPTITKTSGGISSLPLSYLELHPYIRRNGPEGDYHTLTPLEFHANTSLLLQMLRKGHYNVKLDADAWDRLLTWIDINVPAHGTFHEAAAIPSNYARRRNETKKKYANLDEDIEMIPVINRKPESFVKPEPLPERPARLTLNGWPIGADKAKQMQSSPGVAEQKLDLGNNVAITLKRIPAGEFVMGDVDGYANEFPMTRAKIERAFWMASTEISLEQYQQFNAEHRNGYYDMHYKDQVKPGYLMDSPQFPAIRVSWHEAVAFCQWLSARTGKSVLLPTEAQWEWACRAGTDSPMFYGDLNANFATFANLADASLAQLAVTGVDPQPIKNPDKFWDFVPKEARFNDGVLHLASVGHYEANAWGLRDMIGNVGEWTLDDYRPQVSASAKAPGTGEIKTVRGGSWRDRPKESRASARWDYPAWQRVYNVGFRVVVLD